MWYCWMFFFQAGEENPVISLYVVNLNGPLHTIEMRRPEDQRIGWADALIYFPNVHYGEFYNGCRWEICFLILILSQNVCTRLRIFAFSRNFGVAWKTLLSGPKVLWWKWYEIGGKTIFQCNTFATERKRFSKFSLGKATQRAKKFCKRMQKHWNKIVPIIFLSPCALRVIFLCHT